VGLQQLAAQAERALPQFSISKSRAPACKAQVAGFHAIALGRDNSRHREGRLEREKMG